MSSSDIKSLGALFVIVIVYLLYSMLSFTYFIEWGLLDNIPELVWAVGILNLIVAGLISIPIGYGFYYDW